VIVALLPNQIRSIRRQPRTKTLAALVVAFAAFLVGLGVCTSKAHLVIAVVLAVALGSLVIFNSQQGLVALVVFSLFLGLFRRLLSWTLGSTPTTDPVLIVVPIAIVLLFVLCLRAGAMRERSRLCSVVLALEVLATVQVFNPLQGSLTSGFAGFAYVVIPSLLFWVGRSIVSERTIRAVFSFALVGSVITAVYGYSQVFIGFAPWDKQWLNSVGNVDLSLSVGVNGQFRPFGFSTSQQDYGRVLAIGVALTVAMFLARRRGWRQAALVFTPLLLGALFLASSRISTVAALLAASLIFAVHRRMRLVVALAVACLCLGLLVVGAGKLSSGLSNFRSYKGNLTGALVSHELNGLGNPLSDTNSTLGTHVSGTASDIKGAFTHNPLGYGTGEAIPNAVGSRIGNAAYQAADYDVAHVAVGWGLPGLVLWLMLNWMGFRRGFRYAKRERTWIAYAILGILAAMILEWINGDLYATSPILWIALGYLDSRTRSFPAEEPEPIGTMALPAAT